MRLKIVTYNIKSGLYHPDGLEAIARVLEASDPHVVSLQEVDRDTRRAGQEDQTAWLAKRLGMPYHCFGAATPWEGGGEYGVAVISRLPITQHRATHLWVPQGPEVRHGEREPRMALGVSLPGDGTEAFLIVTHLGLTAEQRENQARQILELGREATAEGKRVIITGDLNGRPDSREVRLLSEEFRDVLGDLPESERVTFPSGDPEMHGHDFLARTIDYIFVGEGIEVESARIVPEFTLASDHNPCEATLLLADAAGS